MPRTRIFCAVLAIFLAGTPLFSTGALAEFFGCNDLHPGRVLSDSRTTHEFAAQTSRPRVTVHPRRHRLTANSVRQCRSRLVKEYRISGTVIVPHMQCWWE